MEARVKERMDPYQSITLKDTITLDRESSNPYEEYDLIVMQMSQKNNKKKENHGKIDQEKQLTEEIKALEGEQTRLNHKIEEYKTKEMKVDEEIQTVRRSIQGKEQELENKRQIDERKQKQLEELTKLVEEEQKQLDIIKQKPQQEEEKQPAVVVEGGQQPAVNLDENISILQRFFRVQAQAFKKLDSQVKADNMDAHVIPQLRFKLSQFISQATNQVSKPSSDIQNSSQKERVWHGFVVSHAGLIIQQSQKVLQIGDQRLDQALAHYLVSSEFKKLISNCKTDLDSHYYFIQPIIDIISVKMAQLRLKEGIIGMVVLTSPIWEGIIPTRQECQDELTFYRRLNYAVQRNGKLEEQENYQKKIASQARMLAAQFNQDSYLLYGQTFLKMHLYEKKYHPGQGTIILQILLAIGSKLKKVYGHKFMKDLSFIQEQFIPAYFDEYIEQQLKAPVDKALWSDPESEKSTVSKNILLLNRDKIATYVQKLLRE